MKIASFIVAIISCLTISGCQYSFFTKCFHSQPDDSRSFAESLAMSDRYLAVGDTHANRVIVYTRDQDGQWIRTKEILPPKDSIPDKYNFGFGSYLLLDKSNLVIYANIQKQSKEVTNLNDFQWNGLLSSSFNAIYYTDLDKETVVKRIDIPKKGEMPGSVSIDNDSIAFSTLDVDEFGSRLNRINILSNGKISYLLTSAVSEGRKFGKSIALKNNLLLVSASLKDLRTAGWLFNLGQPNKSPKRIVAPEDFVGSYMQLSEQFAVVGKASWRKYSGALNIPSKTLIASIETGSTRIINGYGKLSLSGNILARLRYGKSSIKEENLLEVFRLADDATPLRIIKRKKVEHALVYNNLLTTVQKTNSGITVCIEQVH